MSLCGASLAEAEYMGEACLPEELALRQLRHHSKNALQRLLCQVEGCPGLQRDAAGRALAADLERRIQLSAQLSDALFGLTHAPGPLEPRLEALCEAVVGLLSDGDQMLSLSVAVHGAVPAGLDHTLVRIAHELVGNAVKHGMRLRMVGRIEVTVQAMLGRVVMTVADDGWGFCDGGRPGEGLSIAGGLAAQQQGEVQLRRDRCFTIATVTLPVAATEVRQ